MRDLAVYLAIFGLIPLILWRPWIGALGWAWVGLMSPHMLAYGARSLPVAMLIGGATLVGLLYAKDKKFPPGTLPMLMMGLLLIFFTAKMPYSWVLPDAWVQWDKVFKVLLMTFVITILIHGKQRILAFIWTIIFSLGALSAKGGVFAITSGGVHRVWGPENSFIYDNNDFGVAMLMVLPLMFFFARSMTSKWLKLIGWFLFWITIVAIVFTYSRGALVGTLIILSILFLLTKRKILVLVCLVPILSTAITFAPEKLFDRAETIKTYEEDRSARQRFQAWSVQRNIALAHPFLGAGFLVDNLPFEIWGTYADPEFTGEGFDRTRAAHSIYFQMLGEHGFTGLTIFILMLLGTHLTLIRCKSYAKQHTELTWLLPYATGLQIGLLGYMISGSFVNLSYFDLFYYYVAIAAMMWREVRTHQRTLQHQRLQERMAALPGMQQGNI